MDIPPPVKTAREMALGFPAGSHRARALNAVRASHREGKLEAAGEISQLLAAHAADGDIPLAAVIGSWIRVTEEE